MNKNKKNKKGSVLIYALVLMFLLTAIGLDIMSSAVSNQKNAIMDEKTKFAFSAVDWSIESYKINVHEKLKGAPHYLKDYDCQDSPEPQKLFYLPGWNSDLGFYYTSSFYGERYDGSSYLLNCENSVMDVKFIDSIGHYKDAVRATRSPTYLDFRDKGLIANWRPEKDSGDLTYVPDSSKNGHSGDLQGVNWDTDNFPSPPGLVRDILEFDNRGDFVEINGLLDEPQSLTISASIYRRGLDTSGVEIVSLGGVVGIRILPNQRLSGYYYRGLNIYNTSSNSVPIVANKEWHQIAYVIDRDNNRQAVYIDGTEYEDSSHGQDIGYSNAIEDKTFLGITPRDSNHDFRGEMRNIRIYNRALSEMEIKMLANGVYYE
jgi:hypothetical protein